MADTDPVQPEGQGGSGGDAPYQEYLNRIPEEYREQVEPVFREWDSNTTRRFQEAADQRRGWEPYEKLGVNQRDPEEVQWMLQFRDALENPQLIKDWYAEYSQLHGLNPAESAAGEGDPYVDPAVAELRSQLGPLATELADLRQWRETQERQATESQAQHQLESQLESLKQQHGAEYNEAAVRQFLPQYLASDREHAAERAYADYQALRSQIEKDTLAQKANPPAPALSGGGASGTPDPPPKGEALKWAAEKALAQLRAERET